MKQLGNYMYPGMTQAQIDYYAKYIGNLPQLSYNHIKRKALRYYKEWNKHIRQPLPKETCEQYMIRYLHRH